MVEISPFMLSQKYIYSNILANTLATEDEMAGWHHRVNGHEVEKIWGFSVLHRGAWHAAVHEVANSQTQLNH